VAVVRAGTAVRYEGVVKIGITTFCTDRTMRPDRLARECEARGFESLWFPEHSNIPVSRMTPWPGATPGNTELPDYYARSFDAFGALSMSAAVTSELRLGIGVSLVLQRDPVWTAKQVSTLDHLSGGRFELAIGFGWNREEAEQHGVDWAHRRAITREKIMAMKSLWTDDVASFRGEHVTVEPTWQYPKPAQPGGPAVLVGGGTGPVLFDHIASWADGWCPISAKRSLAEPIGRLRETFAAKGRDPGSLRVTVFGARTDVDVLANLASEGVERAVLTIWPEDEATAIGLLDEWAPFVPALADA
jgi:probable F420-dependent oxidoreductase